MHELFFPKRKIKRNQKNKFYSYVFPGSGKFMSDVLLPSQAQSPGVGEGRAGICMLIREGCCTYSDRGQAAGERLFV